MRSYHKRRYNYKFYEVFKCYKFYQKKIFYIGFKIVELTKKFIIINYCGF